jgi:hypothetical protein
MQAAFGMGRLFGDTSASLSAQTSADFSSEGGLLHDDHGAWTKIPKRVNREGTEPTLPGRDKFYCPSSREHMRKIPCMP